MQRWKQAMIAVTTATIAFGISAEAMASSHTDRASSSAVKTTATTGNSCHTKIEEDWAGTNQRYRVGAKCDQLDRGVKARGVMDRAMWPDEYTDWFTDTGTWHWTDWEYETWGSVAPKARMEYGTHAYKPATTSMTFADGTSTATIGPGEDITMKVTVPADATGEMYFQVRHPDGTTMDLPITYHLVPGAGYHVTISHTWLKPGHNIIRGFYTGDHTYSASNPMATINVESGA